MTKTISKFASMFLLTGVVALSSCGDDSTGPSEEGTSSTGGSSASTSYTLEFTEGGDALQIKNPTSATTISVGTEVTIAWCADLYEGFTSFDLKLSTDSGRSFEVQINTEGSVEPAGSDQYQCFEYPWTPSAEQLGDASEVILAVQDYSDKTMIYNSEALTVQ